MKFKEYINEGGKASRGKTSSGPKMLTGTNLTKFLKVDKNWEKYQEAISQFFEDGSWSKGDSVRYDIMELMFGDDYSWQEEYGIDEKKGTWSTADKRLRGALKKLDKEYVISKADCYKKIRHALSEDGDVFSDIIYAILDSKKNGGVKVEYPEFKHYRDVENWMNDFKLTDRLSRGASKDDICLLLTEGIDSISISKVEHDEYISVGSRTSTWTFEYKIDIVTYSTNKVISFNVSKSETNRL